jgi:hypothetical protein
MVGPTMPISIKKKQDKKQKRGSQSSPLLVKLPCPPMPKNTKKKRKEEEWVHAYLGVVDGAFTISNACAQALSSLGSLLLKFMFQAFQAFSFVKHSKLQAFQVHTTS